MNRRRKFIGVVNCAAMLALFWVGLLARDVAACSCAPSPPPKEALEKSAAVFLAKVVKIEETSEYERTVTLEVERWWKGGDSAKIVVSTAKDGAACGYGFEKGKRYLVYAHGRGEEKDQLGVSLCSRTCKAEDAESRGEMKELGEGEPVAAEQ